MIDNPNFQDGIFNADGFLVHLLIEIGLKVFREQLL